MTFLFDLVCPLFRQLRVHRIILHQNLFFSLILNALLVVIFQTSVMMSERNSMTDGDAHSIVKKVSTKAPVLQYLQSESDICIYMSERHTINDIRKQLQKNIIWLFHFDKS